MAMKCKECGEELALPSSGNRGGRSYMARVTAALRRHRYDECPASPFAPFRGLDRRVANAVMNAGFSSVEQLVASGLGREDVLKWREFGPVSLRKLEEFMAARGIGLSIGPECDLDFDAWSCDDDFTAECARCRRICRPVVIGDSSDGEYEYNVGVMFFCADCAVAVAADMERIAAAMKRRSPAAGGER